MKEFLQLMAVGFENRAHRKKISRIEKKKLGKFTWYRGLMRVLESTYRWKSPFALSRSARRKIPLPDSDLIYGETPAITAFDLLSHIGIDHADHVVECGGGTSVFSLVAVSAFGCRATVLEIVPSFVKKTREVVAMLGLKRLLVKQSDMLAEPLPEGTLYYLTGTTFCEETWKVLQKQMATAPVGAKAISLSVQLDSKAWNLIEKLTLPFSWGENTVYIQQRI